MEGHTMNSPEGQRSLAGIGACLCLILSACSSTVGHRSEAITVPPETATPAVPGAKNVILFIGDGMGVSTVTAIRILDGQRKGMAGEENVLPFERFPHVALSKTYEVDLQVGESAGTATAIMTGQKTRAGILGISAAATLEVCATTHGNYLPSLIHLS